MNGIYRAKVLDNDDPDKLGRIKVEVYPFLIGETTALDLYDVVGIPIDVLPWATPAFPLFDGAGESFGRFSIPKNETFVFVFFENNDIYQPVYFAEATDGIHGLPSERETNYPNRKVLKTENGIIIELDDTINDAEIKITHPKGTICTIDKNGGMILEIVENKTVTVNGNVSMTVGGNVTVEASGNVSITGTRIDLN